MTSGLRRLALVTLNTFVVIMLGTNSVAAAGGPLTWLTLWELPAAGGDLVGVGLVSLLPLVSVVSWAIYWWLTPRAQRPAWQWGWRRITVPAAALWLWAVGRSTWECLDGPCPSGTILRLLILAAVFFWIYLLIANERPDLFYVLAFVTLLQSILAVGQFVGQHDLGLQRLGELHLDPAISGISVVMRTGERWLRGYGLTSHPNALARVLVICLLLLMSWRNQTGRLRSVLLAATFLIGIAGMLATLSRWAWICLIVGLTISFLPELYQIAREKRIGSPGMSMVVPTLALLLLCVGFAVTYGDTVSGRIVGTDSPTESRSINERQRDMAIAKSVIGDAPLLGVGPGHYLDAAQEYDGAALPVHNVPLLNTAELGLGALALWLLLMVGPLLRRGALSRYSRQTAVWFAVACLGLFYVAPYPLSDMTSAILIAISGGYMIDQRLGLADLNRFA